jgi:hypothetical protein
MSKKSRNRIEREHLNAAMEEFFARGGRVKKINGIESFDSNQKTNDFNDEDYFADYSSIESTCSLPLNKSHRLRD